MNYDEWKATEPQWDEQPPHDLQAELQRIMQGDAPEDYTWWEVVLALLEENDRLRECIRQGGYGDGGNP